MSGEVELRDECDNVCILDHIIGWEERASCMIAKKKVIGRCCPTPAPEEGYITMPREIRIIARMDRSRKDCIDDLWDCCDWVRLYDKDGTLIDYVWLEEPNYRWDTGLGCAENEKPWIVTLGLVCSST